MDSDAALHVELVGVVAVGAVVVVLAAALSGACGGGAFTAGGRRKMARVDDVERALGGATLMTYEQTAAKASSSPASGAGAAEEGEDTCTICLAEYASADEVRVLPACGHFFHKECIDRWVQKCQRWCPLCRGWLSSLPPLPKPGCWPMPPRTSRPAVSTAATTVAAAVVG